MLADDNGENLQWDLAKRYVYAALSAACGVE